MHRTNKLQNLDNNVINLDIVRKQVEIPLQRNQTPYIPGQFSNLNI